MQRRPFLQAALAASAASPLFAAFRAGRWDSAAEVLEQATAAEQVDAAVLHVVQGNDSYTHALAPRPRTTPCFCSARFRSRLTSRRS